MDIKGDSCFLDFHSENERDTKDLVKKVKIETLTSSCDITPKHEDSTCWSENEEHHPMRCNETIEESGNETKIDIKEEHWWLQREHSCTSNDIKDETQEDFYSTKPPSLYKEDVSSFTSNLFSTEDSEYDISFSMNRDSTECPHCRKCEETVVSGISSKERNVCLEKTCDRKLVKLHKCNICDKAFTRLSGLKRHKLIHESIKPHKCNICNKTFTELSSLRRHKLSAEGIKPHKCIICNKAFTEGSVLRRHKLTHETMKPHKCNICTKAFLRLSSLRRHKLIHEGIKPHKCNICNKAFTELLSLRRHKWIHEGIKPHKCNICNRAFTELSNLKRHKLIHEGIKPHKCNVCNKAFTELSSLKRHKLTHEGIKPHKCNICHKAFTELSDLKRHLRVHQNK